MPASRTLSYNPAKTRPTNQGAVPQAHTPDRRQARRNALGDTPTEVSPHRLNTDTRRNAVDGAVPPMMLPSIRTLLQQVPAPPPSGGLPMVPACFPGLPPDAPSLHPGHPYSKLTLAGVRSGNYLPPPPPSDCAECQMDKCIARSHQVKGYRGCDPVIPDVESLAPKTGEVSLGFAYEGDWARTQGIYLSDILGFKVNIAQASQKLIRAGTPGPMLVTFKVRILDMTLPPSCR
ncbi:hypothetical protein B0H12DRAFT_1165756 [Mycena haematopus]|nr:hypothetical protein B0H12DRAFT_1165756 [Mycena haematopus]